MDVKKEKACLENVRLFESAELCQVQFDKKNNCCEVRTWKLKSA